MMVFNMGRSDFRAKHTATNALIVQTTFHSSIETTRYCMDMYLASMFQSLAVLLDVRGIIRMLDALLDFGISKKHEAWATAKTLLQHRAWRHFPLLVSHLPHILLGGTMHGIDLHSDVFEEPLPQKKTAASGAIKTSRERGRERRKQRFAAVGDALDSFIDWLKLERKHYKERTIVTAKSRQPTRKTPGHQAEERVAEDIHQAECTTHGGEHIGLGSRAASGAEDLTLDDRKGQEQAASGADSRSSSSRSSNSSSRSSSSSRQQQTAADGWQTQQRTTEAIALRGGVGNMFQGTAEHQHSAG